MPEWVVRSERNRWSEDSGMGGQKGAEYALFGAGLCKSPFSRASTLNLLLNIGK